MGVVYSTTRRQDSRDSWDWLVLKNGQCPRLLCNNWSHLLYDPQTGLAWFVGLTRTEEWTVSSAAMQQLLSSAPRPAGRGSRDSCDWRVLQSGRFHMSLPSTAALSSSVDSTSRYTFSTTPCPTCSDAIVTISIPVRHTSIMQNIFEPHSTAVSLTTQRCWIYASSAHGKRVNKHENFIRSN